MDWLKRLPVVGPAATRLLRTHAGRAYQRLDEVHWDRLAAAITFFSFIAVFPLLSLGASITAALLGPAQVRELQRQVAEQVPLSAERLDLAGLVTNAGAVGLISGSVLLVVGTRWVGSLRECLRTVWLKEEDPGNPVVLRLKDIAVLLGLAVTGLCAVAGSAFASSAVGWAAGRLGLDEGGVGSVLLFLAGLGIGILADFLMLSYLLTRLPQVHPERRAVIFAGLIGAVGFELLKLLLSSYLQGVAGKSMYGAFGVPVALLLWISLMARLLLYCAAWTATELPRPAGPTASGTGISPAAPPASPASVASAASAASTASGTAERPPEPPERPERPGSPRDGAPPAPAAASGGEP
ncbi:YihY/virulence factor BrkB family protein, partial [Streptomyces sp. SID5475]|nr:YihY/virulence factor BrkB family protein [Streptomyces sp. SID5475]